MSDWLFFLGIALATARATRLMVADQITEPLRNWSARHDPHMKHIGYLMTCSYCMGIWASAAILGLGWLAHEQWGSPLGYIPGGLVAVLAVAQAALWLSPKESPAMVTAWRND